MTHIQICQNAYSPLWEKIKQDSIFWHQILRFRMTFSMPFVSTGNILDRDCLSCIFAVQSQYPVVLKLIFLSEFSISWIFLIEICVHMIIVESFLPMNIYFQCILPIHFVIWLTTSDLKLPYAYIHLCWRWFQNKRHLGEWKSSFGEGDCIIVSVCIIKYMAKCLLPPNSVLTLAADTKYLQFCQHNIMPSWLWNPFCITLRMETTGGFLSQRIDNAVPREYLWC